MTPPEPERPAGALGARLKNAASEMEFFSGIAPSIGWLGAVTLLREAATALQQAEAEARKLICSYCGLVQTAETVESKVALAVEHMLVCEKRPELELLDQLDQLDSIIAATKAAGIVWRENEDGAEVCVNERAEQAEARAATAEGALKDAEKRHDEENDALLNKLDALAPHGTCACSYDKKGDVCGHHSPMVRDLQRDLAAMRAALESIAKNTCCGHCQEAALVARAALHPGAGGTS